MVQIGQNRAWPATMARRRPRCQVAVAGRSQV